MTDQEIYNGISNKDNRTFSFLYKEYKLMIITMVQKNNGNEDDAIDILQEGIIAMWSNISQGKYELNSNAKLSTYLYALCRNIWISRLRKVKPTKELVISDEYEIQNETEDLEENYNQIKKLEDTLSKLKEGCRSLLKKFYYDKTSLRDIALSMGITEKSAKNNKYRCMQKLRSFYENEI